MAPGAEATYYLFMAPRMRAEQSTVAVNKARRKPRWNLEGLNGHTEAVRGAGGLRRSSSVKCASDAGDGSPTRSQTIRWIRKEESAA